MPDPEMVEVVIDSIRVGLMSQQRVVILREVDTDRFLAIWIDPYMAEQITFALQDVEVARPMSHDLIKNMVQSLNSRIIRVEVVELKSEVFYGNIVIEVDGGYQVNIDSRPSDALALAVRAHVPIMVSKEVMDAAGISPEDDIGIEESAAVTTKGGDTIEGGEDRLSVFEDFIENLDITPPSDGEDEDKDKK